MGRTGGRRYRANRARVLAGSPVCHICGQLIDARAPRYLTDEDGRPRLRPDGRRMANPAYGTADHIIAWSKGGGDEVDNLKPAHYGCNASRGNRAHARIIRRSGALKR